MEAGTFCHLLSSQGKQVCLEKTCQPSNYWLGGACISSIIDTGITVEGGNNMVGTETELMDIVKSRYEILWQRMALLDSAVTGPSESAVQAGGKRGAARVKELP